MRRAAILALLALPAAAEDEIARIKELTARLGSSDESMRADAAHDLGGLGPRAKGAVPALTKALGDESQWVSNLAFEAIRKIGPDSVPALVKGLGNANEDVRAGALRLLDEHFARDLKPYLRQVAACLRDANADARASAAHAMGQQGEAAVDLLIAMFAGREEGAQDAVVAALVGIGGAAVEPLLKALSGTGDRVRAGALRALGELKAEGAAKEVLAALSDKSPEVAAAAARAIARIGAFPELALPALGAGLASQDAVFRGACIDALAAWGQPAVPDLVRALGDEATREGAALAFLGMEGRAAEALREALDAEKLEIRCAALATLGRLNPEMVPGDALKDVGLLLRDDSIPVRVAAARCLERLGPRARDDWLKNGASHEDPALRAACFHALGELGVDPGKADDKDPVARIEALLADWKIRGGGQAEEFRKIAFDAAAEARVRVAALSALGDMGLGAAGIDLSPLLEKQPVEIRRAAADALARTTFPSAIAIRDSRAAARSDKAVEAGLAWLAKAQGKSGQWGSGHYSAGMTGLALLSFLAANKGPQDGTYGGNVRDGLRWLIDGQDKRSILSDTRSHEYLLCHGIAAMALVEAHMLTGDYRYRRTAQWAIDHIAWARNPGLAWRYEPRGGENDTHITTWLVFALRLADAAGLRADRAAYEGAGTWIERMTDRSGRTGYNSRGGLSARPEDCVDRFPADRVEPMTAAGLWLRHVAGGRFLGTPRYRKGVDLVLACEPRWSAGYQDMIYWHFATLALFHDGDASHKRWAKPLLGCLAAGQDARSGAWRAEDVWSIGMEDANVYTTSMGILTLLTPVRYPRDFLTKPKVPAATRAAIGALRKAEADEDPQVRAIAAAACARFN